VRDGFVEYACFCGHSFLKEQKIEGKIRHPAICVVAGHYIHFLSRRAGYAEYVCRNCGHPFCFADPAPQHGKIAEPRGIECLMPST